MGQHKKFSLERVLRIVHVLEHAPADPENHRTVTDHQLFESGFPGLVPLADEPVQELHIVQRPDRAQIE
jgi:hypothetical protein